MRLENKTAVVTGAASGLGKAIVEKFLEEGSKVIIVDINENAGRELSENLCYYNWLAQTWKIKH